MVLGLFRKKVVLTRAKSGKKKKKSVKKKRASARRRKKAHAGKKKTAVRKRSSVRKKKAAVASKKKIVRKASRKETGFIEAGRITHYFPKVKAGVVKITEGTIALGDVLYFKGHTTDFKQKITSIQIFGQPVKTANKGKEIGLRLRLRVREGDRVYKIKV